MNIWHDIDEKRIRKDEFVACIEISKGSKMKYELDKETGRLILDRVLYTSTHYPANYGFIPRTYAGDRDPLDVLVLCQEPIQPLCLVKCYPIGVIKMMDQNDVDEKIIAISFGDPSLNCYHDIKELPVHLFQEISHFFSVYKQLEGKETFVTEILGKEAAESIISDSLDSYNDRFQSKLINLKNDNY
ncbi:MAG: inorganic diphosphatase [Bacilli bacterium]